MKKILFTDLDGTLLNGEKHVSVRNRKAIQKLLEAGHYLVIATGRAMNNGLKVVKELGLTMPGCYMLAYNGGVVYDCAGEEVISDTTLSLEYAKYIFEEAERYGLYVHTYGEGDRILTKQDRPELAYYINLNHYADGVQICEDVWEVLDREPHKVILIDFDPEKLVKFQKEHMEWENGKCHSAFSLREILEYLPHNADKGIGLKTVCKILGIDLKNAYAVGDERNDIPMIRAAGVGVAMQNAVDEVKLSADYITQNDNEHDGVAEVIDKMLEPEF